MCLDTKSSLLGWALGTIVGIALWIRDDGYDRVVAAFIIAFSIIQLIEAGIHAQILSPQLGGQLIYLALWLQPLVFFLALYLFTGSPGAVGSPGSPGSCGIPWIGAATLIFFITFLIASYSILTSPDWSAAVGPGGHLAWTRSSGSFMSGGWLYLLGIFLPIVILQFLYPSSLGPSLLLLFGLGSLTYALLHYQPNEFSSMWCYFAVGFAFLAWMVPA